MLKGVACSTGIGVGKAFVYAEADLDYSKVAFKGEAQELSRLASAREKFLTDSEELAGKLKARGDTREGDMVEGHAILLEDDFLTLEAESSVRDGKTAEAAVAHACEAAAELFRQTDDEQIRARASDMYAIRDRMLGILLGVVNPDLSGVPPGSVVVVKELTPYMASAFPRDNVTAICSEEGGKTSHSAILARAMTIPAVMGIPGVMAAVSQGRTLAVDGDAGTVEEDPSPEALEGYLARRKAWKEAAGALLPFRSKRTADRGGNPYLVCANIASLKEAELALENGCEGVGLFRTEMLFMDRDAAPDEDEQEEVYRKASEAMAWRELVIRTMDIGGDKEVPYLELPREPNPFLGYRAVRFSLDRPELFKVQLRAVFRAAYGRDNVKVMIPLVTGPEEVDGVIAIADQVKADLREAGTPFNPDVPLGVMVETPAAVMTADVLAAKAAFFSIGTNDLTQYTLAADRLNPRLDYLYSHFHPAVLRSVERVVKAAKEAGIPVAMCGEAAGSPGLVPVYLAFGLEEWSVNPASVTAVRREISRWTLKEAGEVAAGCMMLTTAAEVKGYLDAELKKKG
jgi:phosphotransferase system enzyme I (PtsI)